MAVSRTDRRFGLILLISLAASSPSIAEEKPAWVGTGSCAAAACHLGRREPLDLKGSEYSFFDAYDPHSRAFSVLYDDRSKRIEKNLKKLADLESADPTRNTLCLSCHVHQTFEPPSHRTRADLTEVADGAGCESCHGAASNWLVPHVQAGWSGLSEREKDEKFGFRPTRDLLARGKICAECHVGLDSVEVNHDLIAAGHPRLNFEYGNQLAKYPKHWRVEDDKARNPDYEAKVWALGQLLAAQASLDLLESRARRAIPDGSTTPWPEFSESSCFACHHELTSPDWRLSATYPGLKPGALPWGTWYLPMVRTLGKGSALALEPDEFGDLRGLMSTPLPDPTTVARRAKGASDELGRRAEALSRSVIEPTQARAYLTNVLKPDQTAGPLDWDRAAQQYLAIVALDKALAGTEARFTDPKIRDSIDRMLGRLDLPADKGEGLFDSPRRYDPKPILGEIQAIRSALYRP